MATQYNRRHGAKPRRSTVREEVTVALADGERTAGGILALPGRSMVKVSVQGQELVRRRNQVWKRKKRSPDTDGDSDAEPFVLLDPIFPSRRSDRHSTTSTEESSAAGAASTKPSSEESAPPEESTGSLPKRGQSPPRRSARNRQPVDYRAMLGLRPRPSSGRREGR